MSGAEIAVDIAPPVNGYSAVQQILSQAPAGILIVNNSLTESVWISDNVSMTSGVGQKLGPKGSLRRTTERLAVYGCADSENTDIARLTITQSSDQLDNPVDVALALGMIGVPNKFLADMIFDSHSAGVPTTGDLSVENYGTIIAKFIGYSDGFIEVFWSMNDGSLWGSERMPFRVDVPGSSFQFQIPVQAERVRFAFVFGGANPEMYIWANNRTTLDRTKAINPHLIGPTIAPTAFVAGVPVSLQTVVLDSDSVTLGIRGAAAGTLGIRRSAAGALYPLLDVSASGRAVGVVRTLVGRVEIIFVPDASAAGPFSPELRLVT